MFTPPYPTDCLRARSAVSARLDAPLAELDALRLDAHLDACEDCRGYAAEVAAIASLLREAPLEQPARAMFVPVAGQPVSRQQVAQQSRKRSRRPVARVRMAAAAVVLLAAATASSFALGRAIGGQSPAPATATGPADVLGLRADSTQQHLLAMLGRVPQAASSLRVGKAVAL